MNILLIILSAFISLSYAQNYSCARYYDANGIAHVKTFSNEELYYCLGVLHGEDRSWEMDYFRRAAQGRLAEVLGINHLKSDLMMRLLDLRSFAEKLWREFPEDKRYVFVSYSQGVNKGFEKGKDAFEFKDAGYAPEEWKPEDSVLVLLLQSFDQTRKTFFVDYLEEGWAQHWGDKAQELFHDDGLPWENTILKSGEYPKRDKLNKTTSVSKKNFKFWGEFPTFFGEQGGSNNWVVSSKKSLSGNALFANDPHLDLKTPLFWYWAHIETPDSKVIGAGVPGVPVFPSGTNGKVAWGLTNAYINSADAVLVKDLKKDDLESFRPVVYFKLWFMKIPFFFKSFEKLRTGHRVLPLDIESEHKLVMKWSGFSLNAEDIVPMFDIFKAEDVSQMDNVLSKIGVPSWNFVFSDVRGDIGFRLVGKTYRHTERTPFGAEVVDIEKLKHEEFLTPEERPHVLKPSRQFVHTANNRHWPSDSLFYGGRAYTDSFRGFRIEELLKEKQSVESFMKLQCDTYVTDARFLLPLMLKILDMDEFKNWDMVATDSSKELPLYRRLVDLMKEEWKVNELALYRVLLNPSVEQKEQFAQFYQTAKKQTSQKTWGEILRLSFPHLGKNDSWIFSPDISGIGDTNTVSPGTSKWNEEKGIYEHFSGASMRVIVELDPKRPRLWLSLPGKNRNYTDKNDSNPWMDFKNCKYFEVDLEISENNVGN